MTEEQINKPFNYLLLLGFLRSVSLAIPLLIIDFTYNTSFPLIIISVIGFLPILIHSLKFNMVLEFLYNIVLRPGLYIWALIVTIQGTQDLIAIAFYVLAALQGYSIIKNFFSYVTMMILFNHRKY